MAGITDDIRQPRFNLFPVHFRHLLCHGFDQLTNTGSLTRGYVEQVMLQRWGFDQGKNSARDICSVQPVTNCVGP